MEAVELARAQLAAGRVEGADVLLEVAHAKANLLLRAVNLTDCDKKTVDSRKQLRISPARQHKEPKGAADLASTAAAKTTKARNL
jgi:hypothetical protein